MIERTVSVVRWLKLSGLMQERDPASLDDLLGLVGEVCTKDQIQALLRRAKSDGDKPVVISGNFKPVIDTNLRDAIQTNAISKIDVYRLITEAEESGRHHIFYFKPKTEPVRLACSQGDAVATSILGDGWHDSRGFPNFYVRPTGQVWADFRFDTHFKEEWTAKLYQGKPSEVQIDERKEGPKRTVRIYDEIMSREVQLVRWNRFGLLELRVPSERTHKLLLESVQGLWRALWPAIRREDFDPFDLTLACRRIIDQDDANASVYQLGDVHFRDEEGGLNRFSPKSAHFHLKQDRARREAVDLFEDCRLLVVVWLLNEADHGVDGRSRTVIGKLRPNEVVINAKTSARAVMHVTEQLSRFAG